MKRSVYLETSFVSHLVGRISSDVVIASHQRLAREWWNFRRNDFDLFISDFVADEIGVGDAELAKERLSLVRNIERVPVDTMTKALGRRLVEEVPLPATATIDAYHMAVSAVNGLNFVLTWNCAHIANAEISKKVRLICAAAGYECPTLCTPLELLAGADL